MKAPPATLQANVLKFHLGMIYRIDYHGMVKQYLDFFLFFRRTEISRRGWKESNVNEREN